MPTPTPPAEVDAPASCTSCGELTSDRPLSLEDCEQPDVHPPQTCPGCGDESTYADAWRHQRCYLIP